PLRAQGNSAAVTDLGLGSETLVAQQGARIISAADSIIAGGKFLEAKKRLSRELSARAERQGQLRNGTIFAVGRQTEQRRIRLSAQPAWRNFVPIEAIDRRWTAIVACAQAVNALPQLQEGIHMPGRLGRGKAGAGPVGRDGVQA